MEILTITKEKTCKMCNCTFIVKAQKMGSGSLGALRRKYCSNGCKIKWNKNFSKKMLNVSCLLCKKMFKTYPSTKTRYCSYACKHLSHGDKLRHERQKRKCLVCDVEMEISLTSKQKFCNKKCSYIGKRKRVECSCSVCGKNFSRKTSSIKSVNVFCCRSCQFVGQSCGLIKIYCTGRRGERLDLPGIIFRSSFEADFMRVANFLGKKLFFEQKTYEILLESGKCVKYTPDFIDEDGKLYELKACRNEINDNFSKIMNSNIQKALKLQTTEILKIVYMNDFYKELKENGLYNKIPNLENRDYNGTRKLILNS